MAVVVNPAQGQNQILSPDKISMPVNSPPFFSKIVIFHGLAVFEFDAQGNIGRDRLEIHVPDSKDNVVASSHVLSIYSHATSPGGGATVAIDNSFLFFDGPDGIVIFADMAVANAAILRVFYQVTCFVK